MKTPKLKPVVHTIASTSTLEVPEILSIHLNENPEEHKKTPLEVEVIDIKSKCEIPESALF